MSLDILLGVVLVAILGLWLVSHKEKVVVHKFLFPLFYIVQYRDKIGIDFMKYCARLRWLWRILGWVMVIIGFVGMVLMFAQLVWSLLGAFRGEITESVGIIQPFMNNIPGTIFVPFLYFVLSIVVIAVVHEFLHGVMAYVYGLKVKSSGFAVFGVLVPLLPAAFVEPDETKLKKLRLHEQLAIFAAGPFANIVLALLVLGLISALQPGAWFVSDGLEIAEFAHDHNQTYPAERVGLHLGEVIMLVDDMVLESPLNLTHYLSHKHPGDKVDIHTNMTTYRLVLAAHPNNASKSYLGVVSKPHIVPRQEVLSVYGPVVISFVQWFFGLLMWILILSIGIGLFNLLPLGPIDGGRMIQAVAVHMWGDRLGNIIWLRLTWLTLVLLVMNLLMSIL
ncbi:MAG: site-2 protease family protein [Nanoarchaeota archaeon]